MEGVGILNVQEADNYGAVLQCYALQSSIEELGYQVWVIDYRPTHEKDSANILYRIVKKGRKDGFKSLFAVLYQKLAGKKKIGVNVSSDIKKKRFEDFRKAYLHRTHVYHGMGDSNVPLFKTYVVGSDVVWKPDRVESSESDVYFLKFTDGFDCVRIAYAASIGTSDEDRLKEIREHFSAYIQRFDYISLRESVSVPYVQSMVDKKVFSCVDPTLLHGSAFYDKIADGVSTTADQKYIYFYMFGDEVDAYDFVNRCSKQRGLPIVCQCNKPECISNILMSCEDDGPAEFLDRIRNAEYVITDSFHGTIFSILFQRNFVTLSRGNISIRMQNLLEGLELQERYFDNAKFAYLPDCSPKYEAVFNKINQWRDESMMFLKESLNNTRGGV